MLSRSKTIQSIFNKHGENAVYITNTGYISRAVYKEYPNNKNIFYMQGSMGLAPCIGLGMALSTDKNIVALSGDGALLMHLGITHTIKDQNLKNLFVYVLDNGCHESVGNYKCSQLQRDYPGINKIIKITNDGKLSRVELDCKTNTKQIKNILNG